MREIRAAPAHKARAAVYQREWEGRLRGFSPDLERLLMAFQDGRCAVCSIPMLPHGSSPAAVNRDHDRSSGAARGLLCSCCNRGLGFYEKYQRPAGLQLSPYDDYLALTPVMKLGAKP
jgi:hypothetical protein